MEKKSENKQRKYGIPLIAVLCLLFLIAAIVLYFVTGEEYVSYYYEDDSELTLVSASPSDAGGVSQDSAIVLEWNRPVSIDAADEVSLTPSARGKWSVSGNQLIFTPQQLAAGTYYTVSVPKGTRLNQRGDVLEEDVFFSFETEDPDMRVPADNAFSVDGRSFVFSDEETVSIPVSLLDDKNRTVEVSVYRAEDAKAFTKAFSELFAYPSWAELSIGRFCAEERNFNKVLTSEMAVRTNERSSFVNLGSLPEGQYLVRLSAADCSYDAAVTVSGLRLGIVSDHGVLSLWATKSGTAEPIADGKITVKGTAVKTDENGFASMDCAFTQKEIHEDPSVLAVTLSDGSREIVSFLTADEAAVVYDGDLFLDHTKLKRGDTLKAFGSVFSKGGVSAEGTAMLLFCSSVGILETAEVTLENGYFSYEWENLSLAGGEYRIVLFHDGASLATDTVSVIEKSDELILKVTPGNDSILSGETLTYRVSVTDRKGQPVSDAVVSLNGEDETAVNENGEATFRKTYRVGSGLSSVQKNAVFHVDSPYGYGKDVTVSTEVLSDLRPRREGDDTAKESSVEGDKLPLVLTDGIFAVAGEDETASHYMVHDQVNNTYELTAAVGSTSFDVPERITADCGETIAFSAASEDASRRVTLVSLCKGRVPDALCGKEIRNENLHDQFYGTPEETRIFFGGDAVETAFSTENRSGDYFIRLASKDLNGAVVSRFIPVKIYGISLQCPDASSYETGRVVTLPFFVDSDEELNYRLTIGDEEYLGTAEGRFSVSIGVVSAGQHSGRIEILKDDAVAASKEFSFAVYQKLPMFYTVREGKAEDAFLVCRVRKDRADEFMSMFGILSQPGDQILQRMGKTLFYQAYGERIPGDFSDMNFDLTALQNSNGGFGRFEYAESDLLLSVLVSAQKDFICDRASLCAYLKYRLTTADNPETAALACWGLTCFGYDCSESMSMIEDNDGRGDRVLLYLAEGYEAAGNRGEAERLYKILKRELKENENGLYFKEAEDQYNIANTAFMMDLAQKLKQSEEEGLLGFMMNTKIENQTGRYLLLSGLLKVTSVEDLSAEASTPLEDDETWLSFLATDASDAPSLPSVFTKKGESVSSVTCGETVDMTVTWEKTNNSIYLVYMKEPKGVSIIEKNGITAKRGYYEWITDGSSVSVSFSSEEAGKGVAPEVYVLNLTTGDTVGRAEVKDWKVKK